MSDETYEGWANRETWAFWLHVTNDEGWYESVREAAQDYISMNSRAETDSGLGELVVAYVRETLDDLALDTGDSEGYYRTMRDEIGSWWRIDHAEIGAAARELATDDEDISSSGQSVNRQYIGTLGDMISDDTWGAIDGQGDQ